MHTIQILATTGIILSAYAYYVELHARRLRGYRALCDLSDNISCTKAFTSKYAKLLGVTNSLVGIAYYAIVFILAAGGMQFLLFWLSLLGIIATLTLAYISYAKLKNFCVVCTGAYAINTAIFILAAFTST